MVEHLRDLLTFEMKQCLVACFDADTLHVKSQHKHEFGRPDMTGLDELQLSVYWSRACVGIKKRLGEKFQQILYLSRPTCCVGTNMIIAKYWVWPSYARLCCKYMFFRV